MLFRSDARVGRGARVAALYDSRVMDKFTVWTNEFFKRSIRTVYDLRAPTPGALPETSVALDHRTNEIIDELYPILKRRRIPVVSGPETLVVAGNRSVSFLDPDGNRVEIACNANKFKFDNRKKRKD